jgi:hypothetical protein
MKNTIESLRSNFLFQASLGSKELFHSNMLGWLLDQTVLGKHRSKMLEDFLEVVFGNRSFLGEDKNISDFEIAREEQNVDLIVRWRVSREWWCLFLENKVKSLPTAKQLQEYSDKAEKITGTKIMRQLHGGEVVTLPVIVKGKYLLTMSTADDWEVGQADGWINITYHNEVLRFLRATKGCSFQNPEVGLVIDKYISFLDDQIALLGQFGLISNASGSFLDRPYDFYITQGVVDQLRSVRLHDLVLKLIHQRIAKEVRMRLELYNIKQNRSAAEFTNSTGITSVDVDVADGFKVGVQLQGNQFRLYTLHADASRNEKFALELWRKRLWFYDLNNGASLSGSGRRKHYFGGLGMKDERGNARGFCEYSKGVFLYFYKDFAKQQSVPTIDQVVDLFVAYIRHISANRREFDAAAKR